jgi:DMSO/TMAO reductase YedYZ molybdopterin-dependent catalytic subunit
MPRCAGNRFIVLLFALCASAQSAAQASSAVTTSITVGGNVAQAISLTVADLKRYPAHAIEYAPATGSEHKGGVEPPRHYTGCLLRDVLAAAKPVETKPRELRKSYVVATASDGYEVVFSWGELFVSPVGDNVYVVYDRDGAPLADDEGRIALIVLTDQRPARHVKWLQALTLRAA